MRKTSEHLHKSNITAFREGMLSQRDRYRTAQHLLQCNICRSGLSFPTPKEFWKAIESEVNWDDGVSADTFLRSIGSHVGDVANLLTGRKTLALSGGALVLIVGFSFFFLYSVSTDSPDQDVVNVFPIEYPGLILVRPDADSAKAGQQPTTKRHGVTNRKPVSGNGPGDKRNLKGVPQFDRGPEFSGNVRSRISQTRGAITTCSAAAPFEMELGSNEKTVFLKWGSFPNAAKYHLYVSDDEEILIDEFESDKAMSYELKKPLESKKSYRWKVIITLQNGKTVNVDSQKFTVKDPSSEQVKYKTRWKSATRCSTSQ